MFYKISLLIILFISACSKYTVEDNNEGEIPVRIMPTDGSLDNDNNFSYPIGVFCIDLKNNETNSIRFDKDCAPAINLAEGEYSINMFCGLKDDEYCEEKTFAQKPIVSMKNGNSSSCPLMAAHSKMKITKSTDIYLTPVFIVSSIEFELENIPHNVSDIKISISPVYHSYEMDGGSHIDESEADIACFRKDDIWTSGVRYFFPIKSGSTKINICMDYDDKTKIYSYSLKKEMKCGKPYKFKGHYNDGEDDGDFELDGDFIINGWEMEEEISLEINEDNTEENGNGSGDGNPDSGDGNEDGEDSSGGDSSEGGGEDGGDGDNMETFFVNEMPSAFDIFGPMFVWKSETISPKEAIVTVISTNQWPDVLAVDAIPTLEGYSIDGITGWRMFTEEEAREFFQDFKGGFSEINTILYNNNFDIFYYENKERYLCADASKTFNLHGKLRILKPGEKTKYYLRPVKTMKFILK